MSNIVYFGTLILLSCSLCKSCEAAVGDFTCTSSNSSSCTTYGNAECNTDKCRCKDNFYDNGTTCLSKRTLGQTCTDDAQCTATDSVCTGSGSQTCQCPNTHFNDSTNCVKRALGQTCTDVAQCTATDSECSGSDQQTCQCPNTHFDDGTNCVKRTLGQTCTDDAQCTATDSVCTGSGSQTCQCPNTHFNDGTNCVKRTLGQTCTDVAQCTATDSVCTGSGPQTCQCPNTHFNDGTNCVKRTLGQTCTDVAQCTATDSVCTGSGPQTCQCPNTHFNDSTNCVKRGLGETCTDVAQCTATNSVCTGSGTETCQCPDTHFIDGTNCALKKKLGEGCTTSAQCSDTNSECGSWTGVSVCYCKNSFYDSNNKNLEGICKPLTELKVSNQALTTRSETFLEIEWTAPTASGAVEEFRYQVGSGAVISVNTKSTANITGLTPGNMYTIKIISVDTNSGPTTQTTYVEFSIATKPAVPGPIDQGTSDLAASDGSITIRWKHTGTVTSYTVTISLLLTNPTTVNGPSYMVGGNAALNGQRYTLTVKAHSYNLESDAYTEEFRTLITKPNPPTFSSTCDKDDRKSTSIYVRWQAPTIPNGDILYYLVDTTGPTTVPQFNTSTNVLDQKVEPLQEEKQYCFTVKTVNDGPDNVRTSNPSQQQCCLTKADLSTVPTSVMHSTTSRSIQLSWSKPVDSKGAITGYRLRVRSNNVCVVEVLLVCNTGCTNVVIDYNCASDKTLIREDRNSTELMSSMSYEIDQLLPYTDYEVWINAINAAGDGDRNETSVQTDSEVPQKPLSVIASVVSSSEITVTWNQPPPRPGVTSYYVEAYEVVLNADPKFVKFSNLTGFSTQTTMFSGLEAYWNYTFSVVAATDKGNSNQSEKSVTVTTRQDAPGAVLKLKVERPTNSFTQMNVSWSIPLLINRNGVIKNYIIEVFNVTGLITSTTVNATMDNLEKIFEITPEKSYNIKVYAVNTKGTKGDDVEKSYDAKPGPPNVPDIPALVDEIASPPSTQTTIKVKFSLNWFLNTDNGERTDGGIIVCPASSCDSYGVASDMKSPAHFTTTLSTWKKSKALGFTIAYRVTNRNWIEDNRNTTVRRKRSNQEVELTIGEKSGCDKLADDVYCNGPLPADIRILVIAFVCTSGGCTESEQYGPFKTQPEPEGLPIAIIAGVASAVAVFVIVIIIIVVIKKNRRKHKPMEEDKEIDDFNDLNPHHLETPSVERKNIRKKRPIAMKDFEAKVAELHKDSNLKFAHEYEELKTLTDPKTLKHVSTSLAETEENKLKNRYVNILPYDHTIVKLLPLEDDDEQASTFINANYIPGYKSQREYIASQGPIPSTIDDFWRMVWEQSVSIIVMLTLAKEDGRIKCEMYWPTEQSEAKQFGDIVVEMQSCSTINTYEFRIFKMTLGDKSRTLKHFHFLNWKDFSANVQNDVMVDFISNVRSHVTIPESRVPMIVHCSAGVGRTGTFIALDHMMQFIRDHDFDSTIDIFDFVVKMRECRMYMVQTEQQYIFIHDCIKDILEKKRQKELEDGDGLYGNVDNDQDHNIYSNEAFEPEPELYQNFAIGQPKTEL